MSNSLESVLAYKIERIADQLSRQFEVNKAFFMIINELLKNNAASNSIINSLIDVADGKTDPQKLEEMKQISERFLTNEISRHRQMTEVMLDAMQGNTDEVEKKLNELFR
ncbi:hypothetical protein D3C84_672840 [compost metagenome]